MVNEGDENDHENDNVDRFLRLRRLRRGRVIEVGVEIRRRPRRSDRVRWRLYPSGTISHHSVPSFLLLLLSSNLIVILGEGALYKGEKIRAKKGHAGQRGDFDRLSLGLELKLL
jgi:hypothetical protein